MFTGADIFWMAVAVYSMLASACLCAGVAGAKKLNTAAWLFVGLFTGLLGVIAVAGMPARTRTAEGRTQEPTRDWRLPPHAG